MRVVLAVVAEDQVARGPLDAGTFRSCLLLGDSGFLFISGCSHAHRGSLSRGLLLFALLLGLLLGEEGRLGWRDSGACLGLRSGFLLLLGLFLLLSLLLLPLFFLLALLGVAADRFPQHVKGAHSPLALGFGGIGGFL